MADVFKLFTVHLHIYVLPDLRQYGVHIEEAGVWKSVLPIMADEVHQSVMRGVSPVPTREVMEGAGPVDIRFALSCVSRLEARRGGEG